MRHHLILFVVVLGSIVCFGRSYGQVSSAAFDPNCYFPKIGVPGEIDTIYGSTGLQTLGAGLINLGPSPDNSFGRIAFGGFGNQGYERSMFKTWPNFNLHKLQSLGSLFLRKNYNDYRFGHFRSQRNLDILATEAGTGPTRIYWQDDQGNYDSLRYTILASNIKPKHGNDYSFMTPYIAHLSSDSVDDMIYSVWVNNRASTGDSVYLLHFKGGENLWNQKDTAFADSTILFDTLSTSISIHQGDFRGSGREDAVSFDDNHNMFYFKNTNEFSLLAFRNSIKYDTIFAQWQNPKSFNNFHSSPFTMQAFAKNTGDSSSDFFAFFTTDYPSRSNQSIQEYRIFKGGKDFGSHRWTADSATFVIHEPYYYDLDYQGMSFGAFNAIKNCGHMTGTKNNVLYIEGLLDGGFYGYEFFYVLGDAIDDKIDMFIGPIPNGGGATDQVDTLVADNDNLQDIIMGESGFGLDAADAHGSIYVVHGSDKIPERRNSVQMTKKDSHIAVYPNPVTEGKFTIDFSDVVEQEVQINIWHLLGRRVYSEHIFSPYIHSNHLVPINSFTSGTYVLEVIGKDFTQKIQVSNVR